MYWIIGWIVVSCVVCPLVGACMAYGLNGPAQDGDEGAEITTVARTPVEAAES
jgi:hypothetical protein